MLNRRAELCAGFDPPQIRARLIELARTGRSPEELGRQFEPSAQTIRNWLRQADRDDGRRADGLTTEEREEVRRLRREVKDAPRRAGHPPKSRGLVRPGDQLAPVQGFEFVKAHQADAPRRHRVPGAGRLRQRVLRVAVSPALGAGPGRRGAHRADRTIHDRSRGTYGAPRVHAELAAQGIHVGRKRVARLMQAAGLAGVSRRAFVTTTRRDPAPAPPPISSSGPSPSTGPNRLWVADITYIATWAGFLYLAVVLDAWSRRVVGWAMATHLRTELVLDALNMAVGQRRPTR